MNRWDLNNLITIPINSQDAIQNPTIGKLEEMIEIRAKGVWPCKVALPQWFSAPGIADRVKILWFPKRTVVTHAGGQGTGIHTENRKSICTNALVPFKNHRALQESSSPQPCGVVTCLKPRNLSVDFFRNWVLVRITDQNLARRLTEKNWGRVTLRGPNRSDYLKGLRRYGLVFFVILPDSFIHIVI